MTLEQLYGLWVALAPLTKLAVLSGVIQALGYVAYGWYVARRKIEPNPTSWLMWAYGTALVAVLEYVQIKQNPEASYALLVLPVVCASCSLALALLCWARGKLSWPKHPMDIFALILDVILTIGFVVAQVMYTYGVLTEAQRDVVAVVSLITVNLTSLTSFTPMVRELLEEPESERTSPWVFWALAYAVLSGLTWLEVGNWQSPLMMYPVLNTGIHTAVALLVFFGRRRRANRAAP